MNFREWVLLRQLLISIAQQATLSKDTICQAFADGKVTERDGMVAWGQYLDRPSSRQRGLYGTAAAVGALKYDRSYQALRRSGIDYLLWRYHRQSTIPKDRYEFSLIPKLAAFMDSFSPDDLADAQIGGVCSEIISSLNDLSARGGGWGYYLTAKTASIIPTCLILLSVEHIGQLPRLDGKESSVQWLANEVRVHHTKMHPGEVALALLTIRKCHTSTLDSSLHARHDPAHRWLIRQIHNTSIAWDEYFVSYEAVGIEGNQRVVQDEYLVIPSNLIIIEYLCRYSTSNLLRPNVLGICKEILDNIQSDGMHISGLNRRAASRPNHRALVLSALLANSLGAHLSDAPASLVARGYLSGASSILSKRVFVYGVAVVIAVAPTALKDPQVLVVGLLTSFLTSVFANVWTSR